MSFNSVLFIAELPLLLTALTAIAVMLSIAWQRNHKQVFYITVIGLNAALFSLLPASSATPVTVTPLLIVDSYSVFYSAPDPDRFTGHRNTGAGLAEEIPR